MLSRAEDLKQRPNMSVFEELLGGEFDVPLSTNAEKSLRCRRIPFLTMTQVLGGLLSGAHAEYSKSRTNLLLSVESLLPSIEKGLDGWKEIFADSDLYGKLTAMLSPLLISIAIEVPEALRQILCGVIVNATPDIVDRLAPEDAMAVLNEAASRMDTGVVARQVQQLFFAVKTMLLTISPTRTTSVPSSADGNLQQGDQGS